MTSTAKVGTAPGGHPKVTHWYDYFTVNLFWLGLNIRNTAVGSVFMPYLVAAFVAPEIKNTALSLMSTVGLIIAMLVQPAAGLLSDRSTSRFGRRRPFIFVGVLFDLVFLAAIALSGSYWSLFVAMTLIQFSANISHGPLQGLIPDLVPEENRGRASAIKAILELLGVFLVTLVVGKLVADGHFNLAVLVTGAALLAVMILTVVLVREEPLRVKPDTPLGPPMLRVLGMLAGIGAGALAGLAVGGLVGVLAGLVAWPLAGSSTALVIGVALGGLVAMVVAIVIGVWGGAWATLGQDAQRNAPFTWWVVNRLLFLAGVTSIQAFAMYFLMHTFGLTREGGVDMNRQVMMVVGIFTMIAALPAGLLADRFGHKSLVGVSGLVAALGTCALSLGMAMANQPLVYVGGCIVGLGAGLFITSNWALGTDLVPSEEAGRYLGISNLAGAGAGMIGRGIAGPMADWINQYRPGLGYFVIFGCYVVLFVLSTLSLRLLSRRGPWDRWVADLVSLRIFRRKKNG
jgi:MFS family permease